jgi:hypothetical protein
MLIWLGIVLFVVGLGALAASVVVDRRAASQVAPVERARSAADMGTDAEAEVASSEPELDTPEISPAAAEEAAAATAVARARLAELRAELLRTATKMTEPEPEEVPARETTAQEAERVFAAIAAVGRPESEPVIAAEVEPVPEPLTAALEGETAAAEEVPAEGAGHSHEYPIANHGDLVTHVRSQHPEVEAGGSAIRLGGLHERAHARSADT